MSETSGKKAKISDSELNFAIFLLHKLARAWQWPVPKVYRSLESSGILEGYIFKCYDVLHTLGAEYLVNDITEFSREKGLAV
ncbi:MAG: DUF3791 domain-containing protein [Coriobacteriales bacterium]|jgi:hypothetical protein|nr:DUF3791 domain-containing protein [Coriobacteriales bacterium]